VPVTRAAVEAGVTWLGVHTTGTPLGYPSKENIDLGVSGWELEPIAYAVQRLERPPCVHLKVDTEHGRNGMTLADWPGGEAQAAALQEAGVIRGAGSSPT
jgi:alanine racemase